MLAYEIVDAPSQHEDHEGWLVARRQGVGSSDAPAVCGLSPWNTPLGVYADKVWGVTDESEGEQRQMGHLLEDTIAKLYERRTGQVVATPKMMRSSDRPWQLANIDRVSEADRIVELKLSGTTHGWGGDGTDDVPPNYFVQVVHQMDVYGSDVADLAALICGTSFRVYEIHLDAQIVARMREIEQEFWEKCVQAQVAPPPDFAHASTSDLIRRLNTPTTDDTIALTQAEAEFAEQYKSLGEQIGEMGRQRDSLRAQIEAAIGPYMAASLPNGMVVRRKLVKRKAYTVEAGEFVRFDITKGKS